MGPMRNDKIRGIWAAKLHRQQWMLCILLAGVMRLQQSALSTYVVPIIAEPERACAQVHSWGCYGF
jgi:hypothetical protein